MSIFAGSSVLNISATTTTFVHSVRLHLAGKYSTCQSQKVHFEAFVTALTLALYKSY